MMHGSAGDSFLKFMLRLEYRVRLYRFFFLPPLYIALVAFLFSLKDRQMRWVALTLALFALGTNLFPYLLDHYLAAVTCLFVLVSVVGLQQLSANQHPRHCRRAGNYTCSDGSVSGGICRLVWAPSF